ncbi:MAG: bifunctional GNAT family N-acetyltransferase/class I SAM-dependent methyltransferase [Oscillospiraceae bacterium]|nr:bifunctional GNAT family N-acetyltransferase/class I SAM-dependent methyltransferase [Oscillospiraceae bacterium]
MQNLKIETARLILRPFVETDAAMASYNSKQPSVAHFMPEMVKDTEEAAFDWIRYVNKELWSIDKPCVLFAIIRKDDERCVGCIFVNRKEEWGNIVEMGCYIGDEYQNSGYATEAGKAMIWWVFEKAGQDVISAFAKPENKASQRVIEKLGFIYAGKRLLPHNGEDCEFDYFRLYHTDDLPGPEWDTLWVNKAEKMGDFFNKRAAGYDDTRVSGMSSGCANSDYVKYGSCLPKTDEVLKILDIGCGTGFELPYIWARIPNAHITCLDLSRNMLDLLLEKYRDRREQITVIEASYTDWLYPEAAFDIVTSHSTMHHLWPEEKIGVYRGIHRALVPGGSYIEADFIVDGILAEQYKRRYEAITSALSNKAEAGEYHIDIPCTLEVQIKLLRDAGFCSVEVLDDRTEAHGSGAILQARK